MPATLEQTAAMAASPSFSTLTLEQKLDRFAEVAVRIGLNLAEGQEFADLGAAGGAAAGSADYGARLPVRGASGDDVLCGRCGDSVARYQHAHDGSFDYAPLWLHNGIAAAFKGNAARIAITGADPNLLAGQDPARLARTNVANSKAAKPAMESITAA